MEAPAVLILAAGLGTRMKSEMPKVLHKVMGRPLIAHVLNAARYLTPSLTVVVTGHGAKEVEEAASSFGPEYVRQEQQLGTGHAVSMAKELLADHPGPILIMPGDAPLISPQTLMDFKAAHEALGAHLSVLTVDLDDPGNYGRVIRDEEGWLSKIVEAKDASPEELMVGEINSGIYFAEAKPLFEAIGRLTPDNKQAEYYLTDAVADFRRQGLTVAAVCGPDPYEVQGINDRLELAQAGLLLKARINEAWMRAGVTMIDPATNYIEPKVKLGRDVILWPHTVLTGQTSIDEKTTIGSFCQLDNCQIGPEVVIGANSTLIEAQVAAGRVLPPHSLLSPTAKD